MSSALSRATDKLHRAQKRTAGTLHQYLIGGAVARDIVGVFHAAAETATSDGESEFAGRAPVFGFEVADLGQDPRQGDKLLRPDGSVYRVRDKEFDGTGWVKCMLELEGEGVT